jgi:hypothetical protein
LIFCIVKKIYGDLNGLLRLGQENPYSRIGMKKGIGEVGLLFDFFGAKKI